MGSTQEGDCLNCPAGEFSEAGASGITSCGCARGEQLNPLDANTCIGCSLGKYKAYAGGSVCISCDVGTVADTIGSVNCRKLQKITTPLMGLLLRNVR